ncbi:Lactate utilization protein C [bioreactor metagenome]|uniref:Lactate utilization protein C n=1 Tax=bioreactor metagenome TaxID=1076179 RepID=A0A644SV40_9ZZZZ|nr:lactate utilization protein [Negativicutes bacterium]
MAKGVITGDRNAFFTNIRNKIKTPPGGRAQRVENPMEGLFTRRETTLEERQVLRDRFIGEWNNLGGEAFNVKNRVELAQKMKQVMLERGLKKAMCWDHPELNKLNLEEVFTDAGGTLLKWPLGENSSDVKYKAGTMEAGIVWGDMAMAESGTVVITGNAKQPTTVAILPLTFMVVFTTAQLVDGMYSVMKEFKKRYGTSLPTTATFISGPSRTTDIEMDLTIGVHGPRYVYAFILNEE